MGRPRDPRIDTRILRETRRQLRRYGYRDLRVAAVAAAAGVTAPTLRLRWRTKAELVHDAIFTDADEPQIPDTGSLDGDIAAAIAAALAEFSSPEMKAGLMGLTADIRNHPELQRRLDRRLRQPGIKSFTALFQRAVDRGELASLPRTSAETLLDVISGTIVMRILRHDTATDGLHEELVELILRGIGARVPNRRMARRRQP